MGQPVGRKNPHKAAPVPLRPGNPELLLALYKRVGEAGSAEEKENTDPLRASLHDCRNDYFNRRRKIFQGLNLLSTSFSVV